MAGSRVGMILQSRDRRLLAQLQILRVIDREQAKLFGPFNSTARANSRLLQLTRTGLLDRVFVGTINGGRKAVYFLPGKRPRTRGLLTSADAFEHQLQVNFVYYVFSQSGQLQKWHAPDAPLAPEYPIIPDAFAVLGETACFLEVDRGTEALAVVEKKIAAYLALASSGECLRLVGYPRFRLLIVTTGERRLDNLRKVVARMTDKIVWLTTISTLKHTPDLSSPVWLRPTGAERVVLIQCNTAAPADTSQQGGPDSVAGAGEASTAVSVPGSTTTPEKRKSAPPADHGT